MSLSPQQQQPTAEELAWGAKRQQAGHLLDQVLDEVMTPRQALNRWPVSLPGLKDASLESAYQALWHFEADEDQQQKIVYYMDAQLELLKQMSRYLMAGKPLPAYLERPYPESMKVRYYQDSFSIQDVWLALVTWTARVGELVQGMLTLAGVTQAAERSPSETVLNLKHLSHFSAPTFPAFSQPQPHHPNSLISPSEATRTQSGWPPQVNAFGQPGGVSSPHSGFPSRFQ